MAGTNSQTNQCVLPDAKVELMAMMAAKATPIVRLRIARSIEGLRRPRGRSPSGSAVRN
jgi:hypothetical protein